MPKRSYRFISEVDTHIAAEGIVHCPPDRMLPSETIHSIGVLAIVANRVLDIIPESEVADSDD